LLVPAPRPVTGGRNGYGAKLANIFSTEFTVEVADSVRRLLYKQTFRRNMSDKDEPQITPYAAGGDYTRVTFRPDFRRFGMDGLEADTVRLLTKRVYDMAGILGESVTVQLNGKPLPIRSFEGYVGLYITDEEAPRCWERVNDRWEVCVTLTDGLFHQVSFVNGICTTKGGQHVNYISDQVTNAVAAAVNKAGKNKGIEVKPLHVRNYLHVFVNCQVENPAFDSQTKETLTTRQSDFGSVAELSAKFIKKVLAMGIVERVQSWAKFKATAELQRQSGPKRGNYARIMVPKLDDANLAGTAKGQDCTLILTEGDSAKSLAIAGLSVVGRDYFGVFPLKGKLLNVREASHKQIMANGEIGNIVKILGLQYGQVYTDARQLRYGHVIIMSDQDHDGSHIKGLVLNFLHHFWPSLLALPGFVRQFITPIVKATKGKAMRAFFTLPEYQAWKEAVMLEQGAAGARGAAAAHALRGWQVKYYKGLGTSTAQEAKEYFAAIDKHQIDFAVDDPMVTGYDPNDLIDLAFSKKRADDRKEWLRGYVPGTHVDYDVERMLVSDFIHKELILFSMADNVRSIPSVVDGLKPAQRKVLFACFKRNLKTDIKVAQLGGYVSEHASYHHGEASLAATIVGMAQNFVGSNNINLLVPSGQFGTRLQGGRDAASARYIFTRLSNITRAIFPADDDALLKYLDDDGQSIEPEWYLPIIPMVLVNGADGIGTGWSTYCPNYNPREIIKAVRSRIAGDIVPELNPYYRGFRGAIEKKSPTQYTVSGIADVDGAAETLTVTELPLFRWTQDYKQLLVGYLTGQTAAKEDGDAAKDKEKGKKKPKPASKAAIAAAAAKKGTAAAGKAGKKTAAGTKKSPKKSKKGDDDDDDEEEVSPADDDSDFGAKKKAKKKPAASKAKPAAGASSASPNPKKRAAKSKPKPKKDSDDDDSDSEAGNSDGDDDFLAASSSSESEPEEEAAAVDGDGETGARKRPAGARKEEPLVTPNEPLVKEFTENHTDTTVHFTIRTAPACDRIMAPAAGQGPAGVGAGIKKIFRLESSINTGNIHLFTHDGRIQKYDGPGAIIEEFFHLRLDGYERRKAYLVGKLGEETERLSNRVRFILAVISGDLVLSNRKRTELLAELHDAGYKGFETGPEAGANQAAEAADADGSDDGSDVDIGNTIGKKGHEIPVQLLSRRYQYLLNQPLWALTLEKVQQLRGELAGKEEQLAKLKATRPDELWLADLDALDLALDEFEAEAADGEEQEKAARRKFKGSKAGTATTAKGPKSRGAGASGAGAKKPKKKAADSDGDDSDGASMDLDGDSDFEEARKKAVKKAAPAPAKPASIPPIKPAVKPTLGAPASAAATAIPKPAVQKNMFGFTGAGGTAGAKPPPAAVTTGGSANSSTVPPVVSVAGAAPQADEDPFAGMTLQQRLAARLAAGSAGVANTAPVSGSASAAPKPVKAPALIKPAALPKPAPAPASASVPVTVAVSDDVLRAKRAAASKAVYVDDDDEEESASDASSIRIVTSDTGKAAAAAAKRRRDEESKAKGAQKDRSAIASPPKKKLKRAVVDSDEDDDISVSSASESESDFAFDSESSGGAKKKPKAKAAPAAAAKKPAAPTKASAPTKPAGTQKEQKKTHNSDDDDLLEMSDSSSASDRGAKTKKKPTKAAPGARVKRAAAAKVVYRDDSDEDESEPSDNDSDF
jgi:DNA gyrase/topoisomerase IV subunit B